jgi:hypothetical protein
MLPDRNFQKAKTRPGHPTIGPEYKRNVTEFGSFPQLHFIQTPWLSVKIGREVRL